MLSFLSFFIHYQVSLVDEIPSDISAFDAGPLLFRSLCTKHQFVHCVVIVGNLAALQKAIKSNFISQHIFIGVLH